MNFEAELKKRNISIRTCSIQSGIPYATLYPIIKGQVDIGTCSYYTVEKLAKFLGYRPDEIVYHKIEFEIFRNDLHHKLRFNELAAVLNILEKKDIQYYELHEDYLKAFYLIATVDYISKKNDIPICEDYNELRGKKLAEPFYVGDSKMLGMAEKNAIPEFVDYNIYEGDLYDAV